jgi:hypothetical protein
MFITCVLGMDDYIPYESLGVEDEDEITGERLSVPGGLLCSVPPMLLNRPSEISRCGMRCNSAMTPLTSLLSQGGSLDRSAAIGDCSTSNTPSLS